MATVTVTYFTPAQYEGFGVIGNIINTESITSSGTSQQSTNAAGYNEIVRVAVSGGSIHVLVGNDPTADTDDLLLTDGTVEYFQCTQNDEVAIIDAS